MEKRRINLTLSEELLEKLKERAEKEYRTLSAEIEYLLTQSLKTPVQSQFTPAPFTPIATPENPTGDSIITADGRSHKKHPLIWLQENNIDPMDTNSDTFHRFQKVYPDTTILEFYNYQESRRK